ncbi:capsular biosynthesis protein [Sporosarcina ureae]|uniref:CpsD/CapB family tyrosine-protein kinase n=1 Tax=Sporosarcina ureae TaxID=1571 RepID=UPI000A1603A3|nr:CpsD/CapB family tyrosine-protein kinase [Sporosarcina ureae]ARJ39626.1 capsular biosynthesis protein [Sporosarcina ureae]
MVNKISRKKKRQAKRFVGRKLVTQSNSKSSVSEQFRTLRTNINFSMPDQELKTILFTSAAQGEGKSTISANTAIVFAQAGKKVLLIDADMRKPTTHYTFNRMNATGLSNLLTRNWEIKDVIQKTDIEGLDLITSGPIPPNPAELLGSKTMDHVLEQLTGMYDLLLFDAPPVLNVTDAQILSHRCDGTIIVLHARKTEKDSVVKAKEALLSSQANIIGTVLNNFERQKDHYYNQYYGNVEAGT